MNLFSFHVFVFVASLFSTLSFDVIPRRLLNVSNNDGRKTLQKCFEFEIEYLAALGLFKRSMAFM
jgi:hypothetical protein